MTEQPIEYIQAHTHAHTQTHMHFGFHLLCVILYFISDITIAAVYTYKNYALKREYTNRLLVMIIKLI